MGVFVSSTNKNGQSASEINQNTCFHHLHSITTTSPYVSHSQVEIQR